MRLKPTREFIEVMNLYRRKKTELEEARPGYAEPPRDRHVRSRREPLKIRPYISSSRRDPDMRLTKDKPYKRFRPSKLLSAREVGV